ncbi:MAG: hypothetical protein A2W22_06865 [Candidatus Levybacteria bacterium RBG_16_35_11]|nr:MAG: hypothetical protein A2W22_06865 [Candidatus Levybacteria bacterium RBG_16_35_11]
MCYTEFVIYFFIILGLFVGSFLNLVIDRLPKKQTIIRDRSKCDFCNRKLEWFELIPLVSFIIQKRKCRHCYRKLSFYYPFTELTTGVLFGLTFLTGNSLYVIPYVLFAISLVIVSCLIIIFFTDLKYGIIPNQVILFASSIALLYLTLNTPYLILQHLLSALFIFLFFLLLILVTRGRGMGMGDAKFAFFIGLLLGFPLTIFSIYLAFLTGALVSIILILLGIKKLKKDTIPFGPFLAGSTLLTYFYGNEILKLLLKLLNL